MGADTAKMAAKRSSCCSELIFASLYKYYPQIMLSSFTNTRLIYKYFYSPDLQLHPVFYSSHTQSCNHNSAGLLLVLTARWLPSAGSVSAVVYTMNTICCTALWEILFYSVKLQDRALRLDLQKVQMSSACVTVYKLRSDVKLYHSLRANRKAAES